MTRDGRALETANPRQLGDAKPTGLSEPAGLPKGNEHREEEDQDQSRRTKQPDLRGLITRPLTKRGPKCSHAFGPLAFCAPFFDRDSRVDAHVAQNFFASRDDKPSTIAALPATFSQTTRALAVDRPRAALITLAISLPLLVAWAAWFFRASVTVHETTNEARIEVAQASHDIDAPVAGRVVASTLVLGLTVKEGDVLIELDAETERRKLGEEKTRLASMPLATSRW
jgi:biotin carboxyl carrier protein